MIAELDIIKANENVTIYNRVQDRVWYKKVLVREDDNGIVSQFKVWNFYEGTWFQKHV